MAKKKTENKELKPEKVKKEELVEIPNTPLVKIIFLANGKEYEKSHNVASILIKNKKAKLA